jgi:antibiotic biosynthesis monooxygenase (ABM) superfamily enzyme
LIIPRLLTPLFHIAPTLGNELIAGLLVAAILTALLTFVVMPHYTRLAQKWLYEEAE